MLRSSNQNDPHIEEDVRNLVEEKFAIDEYDYCDIFYEHGQWWVTVELTGSDKESQTFSVVDCQTELGIDYLALEEV